MLWAFSWGRGGGGGKQKISPLHWPVVIILKVFSPVIFATPEGHPFVHGEATPQGVSLFSTCPQSLNQSAFVAAVCPPALKDNVADSAVFGIRNPHDVLLLAPFDSTR